MTTKPTRGAIVFGASKGLGAELAELLSLRGFGVVTAARNWGALRENAERLIERGCYVEPVACDVSEYSHNLMAKDKAIAEFGRCELVINCAAAIEPIARIEDSHPRQWTDAMTINVVGGYNVMRAVIPTLETQGFGTFVNISSGAAKRPILGWSAYCAGKAALDMMTECAQLEHPKLRILHIDPGVIDTDMQAAIRRSGIGEASQMSQASLPNAAAVAKQS